MKKYLYLTHTLRDGAQSADISFSVRDKLRIVERFDDVGIDYIEVGFPASNPKDEEMFEELKKIKCKYSKIVAFGRTKYKNTPADKDENLKVLIDSGRIRCVFLERHPYLHVERIIETSPENNLEMIFESVEYLKKHSPEVIYDAEHFFDGYKLDAEYAIRTLKAAQDAKADFIVLCDTNGGCLPWEDIAHCRRCCKADKCTAWNSLPQRQRLCSCKYGYSIRENSADENGAGHSKRIW